jgi:hypothetical protein
MDVTSRASAEASAGAIVGSPPASAAPGSAAAASPVEVLVHVTSAHAPVLTQPGALCTVKRCASEPWLPRVSVAVTTRS